VSYQGPVTGLRVILLEFLVFIPLSGGRTPFLLWMLTVLDVACCLATRLVPRCVAGWWLPLMIMQKKYPLEKT
jgi:hypothetical protein